MLAIIPARSGSKGVPKKNIKELAGAPLISYTIKAAKKSEFITRIIVSTDSEEIADVATKYGAEVPFLRPAELATDDAKAIDVYLYTIERLNLENDEQINEFLVLLPTSPLRNYMDIDQAIKIFKKKNADSVISVTETEYPPQWIKRISEKGILEDYIQGLNNLNRQEYEKTYIPNGAIYIFKYNVLKKEYNYYTDKTYPYIMPNIRSIDIDTPLDFMIAEYLIKNNLV